MRLRHVYLIFCVLGFVLPYSQFDLFPTRSVDEPKAAVL